MRNGVTQEANLRLYELIVYKEGSIQTVERVLNERLVFQDFNTGEREGEAGITCRPKARMFETTGHQSGRRV